MNVSKTTGHFASVIIFLALAMPCFAGGADIIHLKEWRVLTRGYDSFESVRDNKNWGPLSPSRKIKLSFLPAHDTRYLWLRGVFTIDKNPSIYKGITMGEGHIREIYINGKRIETGILGIFKSIHFSPLYSIPENIITGGENTFYARIGMDDDNYSSALQGITVRSGRSFKNYQLYCVLLYIMIPFGLIMFFMGLLLLSILGLFQYIKAKYFKYGIIICVVNIFLLLSVFIPYDLADLHITFYSHKFIILCILPLHAMAMIVFFQSLYEIYLTRLNRLMAVYYASYYTVLIVNATRGYNFYIASLLIIVKVLFMVIIAFTVLYKLDALKKNRLRKILIALIILITAQTMTLEFIIGTGGSFILFIAMIGGYISLLALYMLVIGLEVIKGWIEFDRLYSKLKAASQEIKKSANGDQLSITDETEMKLKKVIEFVDENYSSNISREGLAAAVDLSPNYMSRLFISYTKKTINGYINELRINEAVERLKLSDSRVLTIALDVGYENLATFNRAFKKITGKTPSEYR